MSKKKKSGNNTINKQYLYCLVNVPFFFLQKIGITGNPKARFREINETTIGITFPIFCSEVFAAYYIEQFLLFLTYPLKIKLSGSGGTEWRMFGFITWPVMVLCWLVDRLFLTMAVLMLSLFASGIYAEFFKAFFRVFFK